MHDIITLGYINIASRKDVMYTEVWMSLRHQGNSNDFTYIVATVKGGVFFSTCNQLATLQPDRIPYSGLSGFNALEIAMMKF